MQLPSRSSLALHPLRRVEVEQEPLERELAGEEHDEQSDDRAPQPHDLNAEVPPGLLVLLGQILQRALDEEPDKADAAEADEEAEDRRQQPQDVIAAGVGDRPFGL